MYKSVLALFSGAFLGKIIGFFREVIFASFYGVSAPVGALRASQSATLIPVNFFTADALNAGFIPLYNRYKQKDIKKAQSLFWLLKAILLFLSLILLFIIFSYAKAWIEFIAPGFNAKEFTLATKFLQIMAIGIPFYILSNLYSYLAISNNYYFLASIRPTIQSIGMIVAILLSYYFHNVEFLAWGFSGAYIFFFFLSLYHLLKKELLGFYLIEKVAILKEFWHIIKPLLLLPFLLQGNILVEKAVSSLMGIDVVASVEYAKFITETGVVLLAVPLGLVGLSTLSSIPQEEVKKKLLEIIPIVLIVTIPISLFLIIYSETIISLIFKRGAFLTEAVTLTKTILIGLSIGFWAQVVSYVMIKALNAQHRNKEVVIFMAIALGANALFNFFVYKFLGPITIGLGATIYGMILFILSSYAFKILKEIIKIVIPLIGASIIYYFIQNLFIYKSYTEILFSIIIFILFWIIVIFIIAPLREIVLNITKLRRKK